MKLKVLWVALIGILSLNACSMKKKTSPSVDDYPTSATIIEATVIQVHPVDSSETFPCNTHPCKATIQVNKIIQKGKMFHGQFHSTSTIKIHFPFTTKATASILPNLSTSFPGIEKGNKIHIQFVDNKELLAPYVVYQYKML